MEVKFVLGLYTVPNFVLIAFRFVLWSIAAFETLLWHFSPAHRRFDSKSDR